MRTIDAALAAVPPQALPCCLAHVKVPEPGSDWVADARATLAQVSGDQAADWRIGKAERQEQRVYGPVEAALMNGGCKLLAGARRRLRAHYLARTPYDELR